MTVNVEVARLVEAPGAVAWRIPGGPLPPRSARRQREAILIVILLAAAARSARLAEAAGAQISRGPDRPPQPRPVSRQRAVILIVVVLAAGANLAPLALFAIALAAARGLVRDSQVIPHALTWYFGPAPAWYVRRQNRRHLRQQMLNASSG
jgi:L-aminopeptidase/D-esterase-like protein